VWYIDLIKSEILLIINDKSGEVLKDFMTEVVRHSSVIMYDTNTVTVTRTVKYRKAGVLYN